MFKCQAKTSKNVKIDVKKLQKFKKSMSMIFENVPKIFKHKP